MKRLFLLAILAAFLMPSLKAQQIEAELGDSSFVSLLTFGPGEEFYTTWGHSAIRICDSTIPLDVVYNYGTFDFNTDHFYLKFARGLLDYCISRSSYERVVNEYAFEGRWMCEQRLNLTRQERNNLLVLLEENYTPRYRYYKYDFFRDNCATRIRDMINNSLCHRQAVVEQEVENAATYRDLLYAPTENQLWWRLGVDLLLGQRCDKKCTNMEYMFSPIEMMNQVDTICLKVKKDNALVPLTDSLGNVVYLCADKKMVLDAREMESYYTPNPTMCFWLLFVAVLALTIIGWAKQKRMIWLDEILFWIVGLLSVLLILMWFGTAHYCTKMNWNILWANPLLLYFAIRLRKSHKVMLYIGLALELLALVGFFFLPQRLNAAVIPIALTLFVRILDKFFNIER